MKLHFTRKTWYLMLLLSAAFSLTDAGLLLFGENQAVWKTLAFAAAGMAVLFLAAEKEVGPTGVSGKMANPYSGWYMLAFFLLLGSYVLVGSHLAPRITLFWPVLAWVEKKRGMPVDNQLKLLIFSELIQIGLLLAQLRTGLGLASGILWVVVGITRGWLALVLYKNSKE